MKKLIKNKKLLFGIIGFVIGISITGVVAYSVYANKVTYDNTQSGLQSTDVQGAIDELYQKAQEKAPKTWLKLGDYFTLVPDASTFTIKAATTGHTSDQIINPSELKLWRVIDIHSDGSVDAVSEYLSSTDVYFQGTTGYANFVGGLQTIAQQYSKAGYTIDTRMMGYGGQTSTIVDTSAFDGSRITAPSTTSSGEPMTGVGREYNGGIQGDTLYLKDITLVGNVYKSDTETYGSYGLKAYKESGTSASSYWLASRRYSYTNASKFNFGGNMVYAYSGSVHCVACITRYYDSGWTNYDFQRFIRPIITLKSEVTKASGSGTKDSPYILN